MTGRALLDADGNWGWVLDQGATMLQSDYAAELIVTILAKPVLSTPHAS